MSLEIILFMFEWCELFSRSYLFSLFVCFLCLFLALLFNAFGIRLVLLLLASSLSLFILSNCFSSLRQPRCWYYVLLKFITQFLICHNSSQLSPYPQPCTNATTSRKKNRRKTIRFHFIMYHRLRSRRSTKKTLCNSIYSA